MHFFGRPHLKIEVEQLLYEIDWIDGARTYLNSKMLQM